MSLARHAGRIVHPEVQRVPAAGTSAALRGHRAPHDEPGLRISAGPDQRLVETAEQVEGGEQREQRKAPPAAAR